MNKKKVQPQIHSKGEEIELSEIPVITTNWADMFWGHVRRQQTNYRLTELRTYARGKQQPKL